MSEPTRSSKDVASAEPLNEARARLYERLMEAQERVAHARYRSGVDDAAVQAALDQVDETLSEEDRREDLYVAALERYVEALGGRLEVRAVFEEEAILLRPEPERDGRFSGP